MGTDLGYSECELVLHPADISGTQREEGVLLSDLFQFCVCLYRLLLHVWAGLGHYLFIALMVRILSIIHEFEVKALG